MGFIRSSLWLLAAGLSQVFAATSKTELIYQFLPTMAPENAFLRSNGQLLVTCLTCNVLSQLDPNLGPTQTRRTVFEFPDGDINVLGIDELEKDVFAVAVGQVDITDPINITSPNVINGPTGVWMVDLRKYQAPDYDSSLVKAHRVGGGSLAGLFDGLAVINAKKGLVAATDFVEGAIYLIDINKNETSVLATGPPFSSSNGTLSSELLANGLKYRNGKLYFTGTVTGTYGYVPVDPNTGKATGPIVTIYNYGFALDDFNFGSTTGDTYLTTFAKPNGGILRRKAGTPKGKSGTKMVVNQFATNSVIPVEKKGNCELLMTIFLEFKVIKATIPGPC